MRTYFSISSGFERLTLFALTFMFMCHITACLWIIIAEIEHGNDFKYTWMSEFYPRYSTPS